MNITVTRITVDQLRQLWAEGGRIAYTETGRPNITQDDLRALASQIDTDDEGMPATDDDWLAIADQLNYAPTPERLAEDDADPFPRPIRH